MRVLCWVLLSLSWVAQGASASAPQVRRMAVIVGANAAPAGRQTLKFSHRDALAIAEKRVNEIIAREATP